MCRIRHGDRGVLPRRASRRRLRCAGPTDRRRSPPTRWRRRGPVLAAAACPRARRRHPRYPLQRTRHRGDRVQVGRRSGGRHRLRRVSCGNDNHWLAREIVLKWKRVLKRIDLTSRSLVALIEPGSCFAGALAELVFAADRRYMLIGEHATATIDRRRDHARQANTDGSLPMSNGLSRLDMRFLGEPRVLGRGEGGRLAKSSMPSAPRSSVWSPRRSTTSTGRTRSAWSWKSARASRPTGSPAWRPISASRARRRWRSKIFGRLTAWQNWIFQRPNAVGEEGAVAAVLVLGFGIGTAAAMFTVFRAVLVERLPVRDPERVVVLSTYKDPKVEFGLRLGDLKPIAQQTRTMRGVGGYAHWGATPGVLMDGDRSVLLNRVLATGNFFDVLGARPALGRLFRVEDDAPGAAPVLVLSYAAWRGTFGGDPSVIGRRLLEPYGQTQYTIIGVAPPGLDFPSGAGYWIPPWQPSDGMSIIAVARLAPGATPAARAQRDLLHQESAVARAPSRRRQICRHHASNPRRRAAGVVRAARRRWPAAAHRVCQRRQSPAAARDVAVARARRATRARRDVRRHRPTVAAREHAARRRRRRIGSWRLPRRCCGSSSHSRRHNCRGWTSFKYRERRSWWRSGSRLITLLVFGVGPALIAARGNVATTLRLDSRSGGDSAMRRRIALRARRVADRARARHAVGWSAARAKPRATRRARPRLPGGAPVDPRRIVAGAEARHGSAALSTRRTIGEAMARHTRRHLGHTDYHSAARLARTSSSDDSTWKASRTPTARRIRSSRSRRGTRTTSRRSAFRSYAAAAFRTAIERMLNRSRS